MIKQEHGRGTVNARALVLDMLLQSESGREYCNVIVRDTLAKYNYLPVYEKAFIKRLFEGCVEYRIQLDYQINVFSKTKTARMKPVILQILRMGVYQILYMDSVPDSAACNEAVALAGRRGFRGLQGFVNGVLRTIARNREMLPVLPEEGTKPMQALSVRYAMPEWLVCLFCENYGIQTTQKILAAMLGAGPLTIRMDERLSKKTRKRC